MALRAPLDGGHACYEVALEIGKLQLCASAMIHIVWYTNLRGVLFMMKLAGSLKILKPILMLSLCENTKSVLIAASYILLKHREQVKYTSEFPTVNPKILLSGPAGSEIYQEMLTKALAKYFGAKLLIFDSHSFLGERGVDTADMISFLLELSFHVTGEAYNMNTLTDIQRNVIKDLADLGLVKLQQGRKESWFIPTKLATNLSISLSDLSSRKQTNVIVPVSGCFLKVGKAISDLVNLRKIADIIQLLVTHFFKPPSAMSSWIPRSLFK
ncbi:hypothetical protein RHGRI_016646 [Rhododendron griersonianum]|uniref:RNA polymerase II transcription factor B subunit 2 n=1 Tax=Rhododendron griersonianum TaxID=479676 RepID=A0AAV6JUZ0_9ERIC|nr:hypothetical protein RHGRI_016646 [Rhododendron griersonianum]